MSDLPTGGEPQPSDVRRRVTTGLAWIGLASSVVAVLDFVAILVVLARWITPAEYGVAVMAMLLFPILDVTSELGLAAAVIQRDDHTSANLSTVFWLNVGMSTVMFAAIVLLAPAYAAFHGQAVVGSMVTLYGAKPFLQCTFAIPQALMKKQLRYKELTRVRILANVGNCAAKIAFAAAGYGIWCFVAGLFAHAIITAIGIQICHPWRPRFLFHGRDAGKYLVFGLKTSASQLLFQFYTNVDYLVVSSFFGKTALGFYRLAYDLVLEPVRFMAGVITEIAFPAFVRLRARREDLVGQFIAFTRMNLVVVLPFLAFLLVSVDDIVLVCWGPEWMPAAPATRLLCVVGVFRALSFVVPGLLDGLGRPGLTLTYSVVAAIVLPASYVLFAATVGPRLGFLSVALAWAVGYPIAFAVLAYLALAQIDLRARDYLRRIVGIVLCVIVAFAASWAIRAAAIDLPTLPRILLAGLGLLVVLWFLLSRFEGISPRSIARAIRGG